MAEAEIHYYKEYKETPGRTMPCLHKALFVTCNANMSSPSIIELKDIDPEDIADVLQKVEKSFGFQFGDIELKDVMTFGEFCDIITTMFKVTILTIVRHNEPL
jgi:NRPS condensation-like uncharacterized protein